MRKQRQEGEKNNNQLEENENTPLIRSIQRAVTIGVERGLEFESGRGTWERKKEEGEML